MTELLRIGTRASQLALWQTGWVLERLLKAHRGLQFETRTVKTTGDRMLDTALSKIGDKGLFTRELDRALLEGEIDLAVHSMKDVPTEVPDGLQISAVTERWDVRDALISRGYSLQELPQGASVATGSLRRKAQLLHLRPDLQIIDLRGNLNTRFRKFDESGWDAMILAVAGVERLGWNERITEKISPEIILPAVGQGSFAVMTRRDDERVIRLVSVLNHPPSAAAVLAERALLRTLEGGCQVPIGAYAMVAENSLHLRACIASLNGERLLRDELRGPLKNPAELGMALAFALLERGGKQILDEIRKEESA